MKDQKAFQDYYSDKNAYCYGCGRLNEHGFKLKSYWAGDETVAYFTPEDYHTGGYPKNVYGGVLASLIDCHANGTAAGYAQKQENEKDNAYQDIRYVTGTLNIIFEKPTPIGTELEIRAKILNATKRKTTMKVWILSNGITTVSAEVICLRLQ